VTTDYQRRLEAAIERAAIMEFDGGLPRAIAEDSAAIAWKVRVEDVRASRGGRQ
jgi:hypothetical protein